jgi:murein DD-endopeptidase MepM/ murein hydrolase activator NlpD
MTGFLRRILVVLFLFTGSTQALFAQGGEAFQGKEIVDTIRMNQSTIILFADKTWMYVSAPNFDGVMNDHVHNLVTQDTSIGFKTTWYTDIPFTYENDISRLHDTIWICTVDSTFAKFTMPCNGAVLSKFKYRGSRFHHGVDIDLNVGDTVRAAFSGRVRYAQYNKGGFGNLVIIRHHNGLETYYAHLSKINVAVDQEVHSGEVIGLGGNTGRSYGPHLHFETRFYDNAFDPYEIIDFDNKCLRTENLFIHPGMFDYRAVSRKNSLPPGQQQTTGNQDAVANNNTNNANQSRNNTPPPANKSSKYYTVKSGDTLSRIAQKHGTSIDKLCQLNGIGRNDILRIGQKIRVK